MVICFEYLAARGYKTLAHEDWQKAWHGCKFEGLYSILYSGALRGSFSKDRGERFFEGAPGVYVHSDVNKDKAEDYIRWVTFCNNGVFWASKLEVEVDRQRRVKAPRRTDQWVQEVNIVCIVAVWIGGRTTDQMQNGDEVSLLWDGDHEANPVSS